MEMRGSPKLAMVESSPKDQFRPRVYSYLYPLPGDFNIPHARPLIFHVRSGPARGV